MTTAEVKLTDEEMRELEEIAAREGRSVTDLIQGGIEALLREHASWRRAASGPELRILRQPLAEKIDPHALDRPQSPQTGINAIIGRWPGDESEDDILAALNELS